MILFTGGGEGGSEMATAADGTHPTVIHSCYRPQTKVICLQACVCPQRGGVHGPSGVHGARGCMVPGSAWFQGECMVPGGAWWRPPRRLLLRTVRILLESILVWHNFCQKLHEKNVLILTLDPPLQTSLVWNGIAKTKLAILAFLYCGEFGKTSIHTFSSTMVNIGCLRKNFVDHDQQHYY